MDLGTPPPSRSVVSGNQGMNMSLSELISWLLEPVANEWQGGFEVNSTDDFINRLETYNDVEKGIKKKNLTRFDETSNQKEGEEFDKTKTFNHDTESESENISQIEGQGNINFKTNFSNTKKSYKKSLLATKKKLI